MIRLRGLDQLLTRSPSAEKIAKQIGALLQARDGEPLFARLDWFLDFDHEPASGLREHVVAALGGPANRALAGTASFGRLHPEHMIEYTRRLIRTLFDRKGAEKLSFRLDDDPQAIDVLGRVLATPHAPLLEYEPRLNRWLFSQFATKTNVDRGGACLGFRLSHDFARDPDLLKRTIEQLREKDPDLGLGDDLFTVLVVGQAAESLEPRNAAVQALAALRRALVDFGVARPLRRSAPPGGLRRPTPTPTAPALVRALEDIRPELDRGLRLGFAAPLDRASR